MATYLVGDVHGCIIELKQLLKKISFNKKKDKIIFVGDILNRGKYSIEVIRLIMNLGGSAELVLGNHDISLIAFYLKSFNGERECFSKLSKEKDIELIIDWLRTRPLMLNIKKYSVVVSHAGISPQLSLKKAKKQARFAEKILRANDKKTKKYLDFAFSTPVTNWDSKMSKKEKFTYAVNSLTRMRFCYPDGTLNLQKHRLDEYKDSGLDFWFFVRAKLQHNENKKIIFGHWASLGFYEVKNATCIDAGCVWGGSLVCLKLNKDGYKKIEIKAK